MTSPATSLTAICFDNLIERLTRNFIGRNWVFKDIEDWLEKNEDRFFLLTGDTGVGKSAIAARFIQKIRQNTITAYHFCRDRDVETVRPGRILRSLAAQLTEKLPDYGQALANSIKPHLLRVEANIDVKSASNSKIIGVYIEKLNTSDPEDELDILIRAPLAELQKIYEEKQKPPELTVILIDSLDEAVTTTGDKNIVRLLAKLAKSDLPDWVRFIFTSRPEGRVLGEFETLKLRYLEIKKESEQSLEDIKEYIQERVEQRKQPELLKLEKKLEKVLQQASVNIQTFTNQIAKLSNGVFLYTELLLNDIETGQQKIDDLSALPKSIDDIYYNFLRTRFSFDEWTKHYLPIFGSLTVTQEPITEEQLAKFTNIDREHLRYYLGIVSQFLTNNETDEEGNKLCSIFHSSLKEYLLEETRGPEFWCDAKKHNNNIVNYYKKDAQSGEPINWAKIDKYGLLHLTKHLNDAQREPELYELLTASPNWMKKKFSAFSSDLPYIEDLELAMNKFQDPLEPEQLLTLIKLYTARLVVQQRANAYQDTDLKTLIWLGRKTEEALSYARLRTTSEQKLTSLMVIANALLDTKQSNSNVLDEATKVAKDKIEDNSWSSQSLRDLVIALIEAKRLIEAEEISKKIRNDSFEKVEVLGEVAIALGKTGEIEKANHLINEAEDITEKIESSYFKVKALLYLATAFGKTEEIEKANHLFREAEDLIEKTDWSNAFEESPIIDPNSFKVEKLLDLATSLVHTGHEEKAHLVFGKVRELANAIEDKNDYQRVKILLDLATSQAWSGDEFAHEVQIVFDELKELAFGIKEDNWKKAQSLLSLANALAQAGKADQGIAVFSEAINIPNTFEQGWEMVEILRMFANNLVSSGFTEKAKNYFSEARKFTRAIQDNWKRAEALRYLVSALAQNKFIDEAREAFSEAEKLAPNIEQGKKSESSLSKWAIILEKTGFSGEARVICSNADKFAKAEQKMDDFKELAEDVLQQAQALTQNASLAQERYNFSAIDRINRAEDFAKVREIASSVMKSEEFNSSNLDVLVIDLAKVGKFSAARKVAYAIEDDSMQINTLRQLAKVVALLGFFKEAFNIFGFKNGLIQFLNNLGDWICGSQIVEQKLTLEVLQETIRIFGWTYPYWGKLYNQLVSSSNEADFPIWENFETDLNNNIKEELNSKNLHVSNIFLTIPPEQAQRFEACIQEAVDILYQNIKSKELTSLVNIEEAVLKQIIHSINTKIDSTN